MSDWLAWVAGPQGRPRAYIEAREYYTTGLTLAVRKARRYASASTAQRAADRERRRNRCAASGVELLEVATARLPSGGSQYQGQSRDLAHFPRRPLHQNGAQGALALSNTGQVSPVETRIGDLAYIPGPAR